MKHSEMLWFWSPPRNRNTLPDSWEETHSVDLLAGFAYLASNIFRETTIKQPDVTP